MTNIAITSLGCAKNLVDSELILGILKKKGTRIVDNLEDAEVIIINTCGFIKEAQEESIETVLQAVYLKSIGKVSKIIAAGCLTQIFGGELKDQMPQVDAWVGVNDFPSIGRILDEVMDDRDVFEISSDDYIYDDKVPRVLLTPPHFAYVKIAEGCDHLCSFCIIPKIKGKLRSRPEESIVREVRRLVDQGVREVILIGQDTTEYGKDLGRPRALAGLLRRLCAVEGDFWIRVLYTYPSHWTDELVEVYATEDKICSYVDIPIQHINNQLLKSMARGESREDIEGLIGKVRESIPGVFLRTSVIVGYPGETEEQFEELCDFLKKVKFERLGAFTFSAQKDSAAAEMPGQVPQEVMDERYEMIMKLQQEVSLENNSKLLGNELKCIVDGTSPPHVLTGPEEDEGGVDGIVGRTYGDAPEIDGLIYLEGAELKAGDFVVAEVVDFKEYDLVGRVVKRK